MEEEIDLMLNVTEITEPPLESIIHFWVVISASVVALLSDILIITTILSVRRLQRRRNFILLHWAAVDIGLVSSSPRLVAPLFSFLANLPIHDYARCTISCLDVTCLFAELLFVTAFISNTIMKSKTITVDTILKVVYGTVIVSIIISTGLCAAGILGSRELQIPIAAALPFLLLVVIVKDINRFCKRKTSPLDPSTIFRLNCVRIYIYNFVLAGIFATCANARFAPLPLKYIGRYSVVTALMGSFYILLYLLKADKDFKKGLAGLFKRNQNSRDERAEALEDVAFGETEENK